MKKCLIYVAMCFCLGMYQLSFSAEVPQSVVSMQPDVTSKPRIFIQNSTEFDVRLSVGQDFPRSIALYQNQILEFPLQLVSNIHASSYGKYCHYLSKNNIGRLDLSTLSQEHPECCDHDCLVNITFEKDSCLSQGKGKMTLKAIEGELRFNVDESSGEALFKLLRQSERQAPDSVVLDAALIWSIFPRVADKMRRQDRVYPYHILGLDVGGTVPSAEQLNNWAMLLFYNSKKRFAFLQKADNLDAVSFIIAEAAQWMKKKRFYYVSEPDQLSTLLQIRAPAAALMQHNRALPQDVINKLKESVKNNPAAIELVSLLESFADGRPSDIPSESNSSTAVPPPPPPPPNATLVAGSFQEKAVGNYLDCLAQIPAEAQTLLDKAAQRIFRLIDDAAVEHKKSMQLKYATLDRLKLLFNLEQTGNLNKINQFVSLPMIRLASNDSNPARAFNELLSLIAEASQSEAHQYSQKSEEDLRRFMQTMQKRKANQSSLIEFLRQHMKRTDDSE